MPKIVQVGIDESGNILIPASLRDQLDLAPGMTLVVERGKNGDLRLRVERESATLVEKEGILVARVIPLEDLSSAIDRSRRERAEELLNRVHL